MNSMSISASALSAYGVRQQTSANNVANMNTDGFKASRLSFEDRPDNQGVRVQEIQKDESSGPLWPGSESGSGFSETVGADQERGPEAWSESGIRESSNTDQATEVVIQMENENGYAANATAIRTQTRMIGEFLNQHV